MPSDVRAFGTFVKRSQNIHRTSAYIQWGNSKQSLGSCLLLNPGEAKFLDPLKKLMDHTPVSGEVKADPTMQQLMKFIEGIYKDSDQLQGRLHIYNLISLQNTSAKASIEHFENLVTYHGYLLDESLVPVAELRSHPWILIGWSLEYRARWHHFKRIKELWLDRITESGIPSFGKKQNNDYCHPCPRIPTKRPDILQELIGIYTAVDRDKASVST